MNQQEALEVQHLAKPTVKALEMIGERECPECKGFGDYREKNDIDSTGHFEICHICNGTGKLGWKWKPEVNQTVLYDKKLMFIVSICRTRLILLPFDIPDFRESLEDYVCTPEIIDVIPILEWEEIERVLEGVGNLVEEGNIMHLSESTLEIEGVPAKHRYYCQITKPRTQPIRFPGPNKRVGFFASGKTRQEAVMKAVIALGKKLGEELDAKGK